jgi:hypothetical protein
VKEKEEKKAHTKTAPEFAVKNKIEGTPILKLATVKRL